MKRLIVVLLVVLMAAPGCSWFKKDREKTAEELASEGVTYYDKGEYTRAIESFEKLKDWYPFSKYAILAELKLADSYFRRGNYEDAAYAYEYFESLHPRNDAIPYVIYQTGMCHFKELALPDRDQTSTRAALESFLRLTREHPGSPEAARALEHIKVCQEHLARHDMFVGAFYFKARKFRAARARFNDVLTTYPDVGVHRTALEYVALCNAFIDREEAKASVLRTEKLEDRQEEAEKVKQKLLKERERMEKKGAALLDKETGDSFPEPEAQ